MCIFPHSVKTTTLFCPQVCGRPELKTIYLFYTYVYNTVTFVSRLWTVISLMVKGYSETLEKFKKGMRPHPEVLITHKRVLSLYKKTMLVMNTVLLGSEYNKATEVFTFYFHNQDTNWYYEMCCRNSFGTSDMHHRCPTITREEFLRIAGDRLA